MFIPTSHLHLLPEEPKIEKGPDGKSTQESIDRYLRWLADKGMQEIWERAATNAKLVAEDRRLGLDQITI